MLRSFSLMVNVYFFAFVALLISLAFAFSPNNYEITCKSYSWWALFPLDASIVDPWVPDQFPFIPTASLPAAFHSLPSDKRMVTLEFNKQTDCFSKAAPAIKTTFTEFKVQVPFLNAAKFANKAPLMYKPVIYADNMINVIAGGLQYGLKTVYASPMEYDPANGLYSVDYSDSFIKGSFTNTSDWFPITTLPSSTFAHEYIPLHEQTEWLGHDIWQRTRCAKHYYLWNETKIRWVNANIKFDQGMVGENRAFTVNINGDQKTQLMTAFQIETTHHISGLEKCSGQ